MLLILIAIIALVLVIMIATAYRMGYNSCAFEREKQKDKLEDLKREITGLLIANEN